MELGMMQGQTAIAERMAALTQRQDNGCWLWQGSRTQSGYGFIVVDHKLWTAHRLAYEVARGPIPSEMQIDHLCKTPACVNPAHLEPVTPAENWRRSQSPSRLNAAKTHCKRGHEFTPENTCVSKTGQRHCRACRRIRQREFEAKVRAATPSRAHRNKTHCPHGHPYDAANTRIANGKRNCRICGREYDKARRRRGIVPGYSRYSDPTP